MTATRPRPDGAAGRPFFGSLRTLQREAADFEHEVLLRSHRRPVLVEFWAPWCDACDRLRLALEGVRARRSARFDLVSLNIEMQPDVASREAVRGLPMVKAYWQSQAVGEITGVPREPQIEDWLDSLVLKAGARADAPAPEPVAPGVAGPGDS